MAYSKKQQKKYDKEYYLKNREKRLRQVLENFSKNREKRLRQMKELHLKNKEEDNKRNKEYRLKNIEVIRKQQKEHKAKPETKELTRKNWKKRYYTDINFKLRHLCATRLWQALKGINKSASTMKLIGCTIDELRQHIESQFEPWMTWENQGLGGWDIDHIKACFHFNLADPEQQRACFNWSNLQPMEHIANIKKGTG